MLISAKEIILKSIDLYKQNTHLFIKYMLVLFIPTGIIGILSAVMGSVTQMVFLYGFGITLTLYILLIILGSVASLWITLAFIKAISTCYHGAEAGKIKAELLLSRRLLIPAILISILNLFIVMGGLILLIVPGIIFAVWFAFAMYDLVISGTTDPVKALKNSKKMVDGRWKGVFWRLVAPAVLFGVIAMTIQYMVNWPLNFAIKLSNENTFAFFFLISVSALINVIISLIITPLTTTAPVILYHDLKKNPRELEKATPPSQIGTPTEPPTIQ